MKLLDYIKGNRKGKEAHRLEQESMQDPFLADAMDGYRQVEGNHAKNINELHNRIAARSHQKKNSYAIILSIAACLVIGVGISCYFLYVKKGVNDNLPVNEDKVLFSKLNEDKDTIQPLSPQHPEDSSRIAQNKLTDKSKERSLPAIKMDEELNDIDEMVDMKYVLASPQMSKTAKESEIKSEVKSSINKDSLNSKIQSEVVFVNSANKPKDATPPVNTETASAKKDNKTSDNLYITKDQSTTEDTTPKLNNKKETRVSQPVIGMKRYDKYIKKNINRSTTKGCTDIKGKVILTFTISKEGCPTNIKIKESLCTSLDEEAIRLIQEGPAWTYGNNVPVEYTVIFN